MIKCGDGHSEQIISMDTIRAKFNCLEVTNFKTSRWIREEQKNIPADGQRVRLSVVTGGNPENEAFQAASPTGVLDLTILNPSVLGKFEPGKSYYLDFSPAED